MTDITPKELQKLIDLLVKFQHQVEPIDKEAGRVLGRAKDYCRLVNIKSVMSVL